MSKQIQLRRGTTAKNDVFIGAVGEITMDTDKKTLRVHDGETPGGIALARRDEVSNQPSNYDFVVETYQAADGTSWYRKYKSGWVEQGGFVSRTTGGNTTVTLPQGMASSNFNILTTTKRKNSSGEVWLAPVFPINITTKQITFNNQNTGYGWNDGLGYFWEVKGFAA